MFKHRQAFEGPVARKLNVEFVVRCHVHLELFRSVVITC